MLPLSISAAVLVALSATASVAVASDATSSSLLQHRHSFFSTLPVEPSDENLKVSRHQVKVIGLTGFREWEVKGSLQGFFHAVGKTASGDSHENDNGKVHMQWFDNKAPLLRPPFTPTYIPGFHLAITSDNFEKTWKENCHTVADLIGSVDCREIEADATTPLERHPNTLRAEDLTAIHKHRYLHKATDPAGFLASSSVISSLISQQQAGSTPGPALIDLVLHKGRVSLKVIWTAGSGNNDNKDGEKSQSTVEILFNEKTDKVVEVGWFYREITEQEYSVYDHYLGATVQLDSEGETVNEALIQTRSPVFPPHRRDFSTGNIRAYGHGYNSTMTPSQSFHPHSVTTIQSNPNIQETTAGCDLHVLQVLPVGYFVDPFQLEGLAPEIGESTVYGETDLEKPVGVVTGWGSLVMVKAQPEDSIKTSKWTPSNITNIDTKGIKTDSVLYTSVVDIPMHMRYQPPVEEGNPATHVNVEAPWPIVAWVCPIATHGGDESAVLNVAAKKLFYIPALPLSLLFPRDEKTDRETVDFRFVLPDPIPKQFPVAKMSVPVGRLDDMNLVRSATFVMAGAGTLAVALALVRTVAGRTSGKGKQD
ncbi:protease B nonderepressible form [Mortierella hygrophila]|uniref:Protein PBN1 n=1 Tax=Mortierella hygrophila TaxID=979708 RepID=A0A9P6F1Z5_9FUNG|nr:protease B nonderepressible form [Mortierella hygrophila]